MAFLTDEECEVDEDMDLDKIRLPIIQARETSELEQLRKNHGARKLSYSRNPAPSASTCNGIEDEVRRIFGGM
jgi:hypothetical protein